MKKIVSLLIVLCLVVPVVFGFTPLSYNSASAQVASPTSSAEPTDSVDTEPHAEELQVDQPRSPIKPLGIVDLTPPVLHAISADKTSVDAPGTFTVTATATDDISGVNYISALFELSTTGKTMSIALYNRYFDENLGQYVTLPANQYSAIVTIDAYWPSGLLELKSATVYDVAGNNQRYEKDPTQWGLDNGYLPLPQINYVEIRNEDSADLATNTNNPDLISDIQNQPDDALIAINYETGSQIPSDLFDAIQGTDKTVVFQGDGIEWVFNGNDISQSKPIDLNVEIKPINSYYGTNATNLNEIVQDVPTIVLSFAENGTLPGKAKIRIKADYTFRNYLGVQGLYVYYYDNATNSLEQIAVAVNVSEVDGYFEFEIDHNSIYIIAKEPIVPTANNPVIPINPPAIPNPTVPYYPSDDSSYYDSGWELSWLPAPNMAAPKPSVTVTETQKAFPAPGVFLVGARAYSTMSTSSKYSVRRYSKNETVSISADGRFAKLSDNTYVLADNLRVTFGTYIWGQATRKISAYTRMTESRKYRFAVINKDQRFGVFGRHGKWLILKGEDNSTVYALAKNVMIE